MDKSISNGILKPVKNRERSAARFFAVFGIISLLAAAAALSENTFLSGIWPVGFLGIFAGAASLVTIIILNKRAKKMDRLITGEKLIAGWFMSEDERKAFSDNLKVTSRGKNKAVMLVVTIFFVVITLPFLFFLERDESVGFMLIMGGIWLIVLIFSWFMPYYYYRNLKGDGKILIGSIRLYKRILSQLGFPSFRHQEPEKHKGAFQGDHAEVLLYRPYLDQRACSLYPRPGFN